MNNSEMNEVPEDIVTLWQRAVQHNLLQNGEDPVVLQMAGSWQRLWEASVLLAFGVIYIHIHIHVYIYIYMII